MKDRPMVAPASRLPSGNPGPSSSDPVGSDAFGVEDGPGGHSRPALDETTIMTARGPRHYPKNDVCLNMARTRRAIAHWMEHRT